MDMNVFCCVGRVCNDGKMVQTKTGTPMCTFNLANNTGFGQFEKTNFFKVVLFGKQADALCRYLTKGKQVGVNGSIELNRWTSKDGKDMVDVQITANNVMLLADPRGSSNNVEPVDDNDNASNMYGAF